MSKAGGVYAVLVRQWSCDGERLESENWIGGAHDGTKHFSPSELYIDFFFCHFLAFEYIPSGHCWDQNWLNADELAFQQRKANKTSTHQSPGTCDFPSSTENTPAKAQVQFR